MTEIALIGRKIGMSREFYKTGQSVPVTVIKMEKGRGMATIRKDRRYHRMWKYWFRCNSTASPAKMYFIGLRYLR